MLITSSSGKTWILPKGHPESDLNEVQVAELETYEEAGVKGEVIKNKTRKVFKQENGGKLLIYPLLIKKTLDKWPEDSFRKRRLVSIKEALTLVTRTDHLDAIKYFSDPVVNKNLLKKAG